MYGQRGLLRDSLCHAAASMMRLIFPIFFISLKFYFILIGGEVLQEQRADMKGRGNEWDPDDDVKDTQNHRRKVRKKEKNVF